MNKKEIINFLKFQKEFLKREFFIEKIGLFGSFSREENHSKSDIDLVIVTSKKSFRNRYRLKKYLEEKLKRKVDIGYYDSLREFIKDSIKDEIIYV